MTNDKRYYLLRGLMLDSEHDTVQDAEQRAEEIMQKNGGNHSEVKIGDRHLEWDNDTLLIYYRGARYTRKGQS